jgi:hypothetical protein
MSPVAALYIVGGNKCNYPFKVATLTAKMLVTNILFSNIISTPGAHFMTMDISKLYLMTSLVCPKYIHIKLTNIPDEIVQQYDLHQKANKLGMIHMSIVKGLYRLPQSGLLVIKFLGQHLNKHGYI